MSYTTKVVQYKCRILQRWYSTNVVYYKGGTVQMLYTTKVVQYKCCILQRWYSTNVVYYKCCILQRWYSTNVVYYKGGTVQMLYTTKVVQYKCQTFLINWINWRVHSTSQRQFKFWIIHSLPHISLTLNWWFSIWTGRRYSSATSPINKFRSVKILFIKLV